MTRFLTILGLFTLAVLPGPIGAARANDDPLEEAKARDLKRLQGRWKRVQSFLLGQKQKPGKLELVFDGDKISYSIFKGTYTIDPGKRAKRLTLKCEDPKSGKPLAVKLMYSFDGDQLVLGKGGPDLGTGTRGYEVWATVERYERVKPAPAPRYDQAEQKRDLKALQGEWKVARHLWDGKDREGRYSRVGSKVVFDEDALKWQDADTNIYAFDGTKGTFTLDASKRPRRLTFKYKDPKTKEAATLCLIYRFDDDQLILEQGYLNSSSRFIPEFGANVITNHLRLVRAK